MFGRVLLFLAGGLLLSVPATAQSPKASVDDLDALVGRWMDLRAAIADETRSWQGRKEQWLEEIRLLEAEKKKLSDELKASNQSASSAEKDRTAILARKEAMEAVLSDLAPLFDRAEAHLRTWESLIPAPLGKGMVKGLATLPATREEAEKQTLAERAPRIAALYTQIESLHGDYHAAQEILNTEADQRRQVDVLYLGLARGFAVSTDDLWAAIGTPGDNGWLWTARPAIAPAVREAVEVLNRQKTVRLVELPLRMIETAGEPSQAGEVKP